MKKIALVLIAVLFIGGVSFAQSAAPSTAQTQTQAQAQVTKVTGKLELIQGVIGIKSGGKTYLIPKLQKLTGFVKGVEEGGTVTVEGYANALPYTADVIFLNVTKLTVGGKDYDLSQTNGNGMFGNGGNGCAMGGSFQQGRQGGGMMRGSR